MPRFATTIYYPNFYLSFIKRVVVAVVHLP